MGRPAGPGLHVPSGLRRTELSPPLGCSLGRACTQATPFRGVPAVGRERTLVGGVEECSDLDRACSWVSFPSSRVLRPPRDLPAKTSHYACGVS